MRTVGIILAAILVASLTLISNSSAQRQGMGRQQRGWGPDSPYMRLYNLQTVETMSGVVESIEKFAPGKGMSHGVHAVLKTDREPIVVHLGPAWFIDNQDPKIGPGDRVEIVGSRIMFEGKPALIAARITKDGEILTLRDVNGIPVWSGWRRR
jgi:hypothetical protein